MRREEFVENLPGEVEMVDGSSPSARIHDLRTENGDAMYAVGQLSDLDRWLDSPEVVLSPLIHREAVD